MGSGSDLELGFGWASLKGRFSPLWLACLWGVGEWAG